MGFDGSGGYSRQHNFVSDKNAGIKIVSSRMDTELDDMASAFSMCITKDGQQDPTANLPMNSKKHTGVDGCSSRTEYIDGATLQDGGFIWAGTASGTSAITADLTPGITAYVTGMRVGFLAVGANASACTFSVNGASAAALVKGKNDPLVANDIVSGQAVWVTYKGSDGFQIGEQVDDNPVFVTLQTSGLATLGNVLCSGSAVYTSSLNVTGATNLTGVATVSGSAVFASSVNIRGVATVSGSAVFTSSVVIGGTTYPTADGNAWDTLRTDGAGQLEWHGWTNTGAIDLTSGSPTSVTLDDSLTGVNEIEIYIEGISTSDDNQAPLIQLGDAGGLETSGYSGRAFRHTNQSDNGSANSTGFLLGHEGSFDMGIVGDFMVGLIHMGSNVWAMSFDGAEAANIELKGHGAKTLTAALDRVVITTTAGTATFDGGTAYMRSR